MFIDFKEAHVFTSGCGAVWNASEDLAIGCIQLGKEKEALEIVDKIWSKFPSSCRASRLRVSVTSEIRCSDEDIQDFLRLTIMSNHLQGMYLESLGKSEEASSIYDVALKSIDSQNLMMTHRLMALRKGKGDISGALELLHRHLSMQLGDWQAWYEAGKLHARRGSYSEAIYCLEEVLMHQPGDLAVQLLLADCLYASGAVQVARKYYSSVVDMSGGTNMKALYGVCLCTSRLKTEGIDVVCGNLGKVAGETLLNGYAKINSDYTIPVKNLITEVLKC
jgi:tetratricopeptide (TPR) repeat protein